MDPFPFGRSEWAAVTAATHAVLQATLADDDVLRESRFVALEDVLAELSARYGQHPVLVETAADFHVEPVQQLRLYRLAIELAERQHLPTLSIRVSLARLWLDEFQAPQQAAAELRACEHEVDPETRAEWRQLWARTGEPPDR